MGFQAIFKNYLNNILMAKQLLHFLEFRFELFGAGRATVFPNNLALYLKDLKLTLFSLFLSKLVASSLE